MKLKNLTESEQIIKYLERKGFKLNDIDIENSIYIFAKGKINIGIKE